MVISWHKFTAAQWESMTAGQWETFMSLAPLTGWVFLYYRSIETAEITAASLDMNVMSAVSVTPHATRVAGSVDLVRGTFRDATLVTMGITEGVVENMLVVDQIEVLPWQVQ